MQLLKQLKWYFIQEYKNYTIAIFLLISISILQLYPPKLIGMLIDISIRKQTQKAPILPLILIILFISIIIYILRYMWRLFLFGASYKLAIKLRIEIYNYLCQQKNDFYLKHKTGDLIARITNDVDKVVFAAGEGVLTLVDSLIMGVSVIIVMITQISWKLTIISLIPMPIMAIIIKRFGKKLYSSYHDAQTTFSHLNNYAQENLNNIHMIKAFGLENYYSKKFLKIAHKTRKKNIKIAKIDSKFNPIIHLFISISHLLAITIGSYMITYNEISTGELMSFILYLGLIIWPMLAFAWMFNIIERGSASWDRIKSMINNNLFIHKKKYKNISNIPGILEVKINYFKYSKSNKTILKNINFKIRPGQILGICGPTGSGKSTLLKLIQRQIELYDGKISYHSIPITQFNIVEWRKKMSIVNQTTFLFSDTIANNIKLGKPYASQKEIEQATTFSDLHNDIMTFPQGYNTQVGERGIMLSGGQKQRISIARALLLKSEILILDNALSSVDNKTEINILENLKTWKKNKNTIIMCTHRLSSLINSDLIIVIENGSITQIGKHKLLIQNLKQWYGKTYLHQKLSNH
ncbi:putative ABC transporter [Buchnera aphidicola str. Bp (Baizongia pistaciae)]|uniref:Multidrug resistance-like ATP-binding protein MdlA n=1 Tax=Buchnera aphidicola subsp. Baizongia pistaciae (strain Bp) TaxID=224915 RepID=MDLA_BUCBP|nr:ABC transporter transmembrane domain-containing protein [Buchnera aphidicola]Q89A97.1 RecName: Full=Multidrug resistance-like ATP-binding protein MdlA [Buchnera aphidicola str. Bp (Baizongia pistaciae)]AAO27133.1 putative ABC transporter [Buchnera aphidicola str. Bp (Baizongia pistaciae)]